MFEWFKKKPIPKSTCNHLTCSKCGHLVAKERIVNVKIINYPSSANPSYVHFCETCRPNYDSYTPANNWGFGGMPYITPAVYYKTMEVSEDGTPLGYVKVEKS